MHWRPDFAPSTETGFSILPPRIWVLFGNTCWRNQRVHNRLQKSLLLWLSGQCSQLAKTSQLCTSSDRCGWCPETSGNTEDAAPSFLSCVYTISFQRLSFLCGRLACTFSLCFFDLFHFIQAGTSESGVLLALHTHTLFKKKITPSTLSQVSNQVPLWGFLKSLFQHQHCRAQWH